MKDKGLLEFEGEVIDVLPAQMFKVLLENGHTITAYTGGKNLVISAFTKLGTAFQAMRLFVIDKRPHCIPFKTVKSILD